MEKMKLNQIFSVRTIVLLCGILAAIIMVVAGNTKPAYAADKLTIDLKENQTFYILPGNSLPMQHQIKITYTGIGTIICESSNISVATVDDSGLLTLRDGGSTKITVKAGNKKVTRTINVLLRTDWTKAVSITNYQKLPIKNGIVTMKIKNLMNYPVKITYTYDTYSNQGSLLKTGLKGEEVFLPASGSVTYKMMPEEDATYIAVSGMTFYSDQFGYKSINAKNITSKVKQSKSATDKKVKIMTATVTNKNKNAVIVPYHVYLYNEKKEVMSVQYRYIRLAGKQKDTISYSYVPSDKFLENYAANVKFVFETAVPYF